MAGRAHGRPPGRGAPADPLSYERGFFAYRGFSLHSNGGYKVHGLASGLEIISFGFFTLWGRWVVCVWEGGIG